MTLLVTPAVDVPDPERDAPTSGRSPWWSHADLVALVIALGVLMGPVVRGGGGRDQHMLVIGLVSLFPALVLGRVWLVGRLTAGLALAPGLAALVVCALAPTGWAGAGDVARLLYAGLMFLAVRAIAATPERRSLVLVAVALGGLYQFDQAYLSWWGRGDATHAMSGTFYASNVFGGYMAGAGFASAALAVRGERRLRLVGFLAASFCFSAVAFSSSRATIGLCLASFAALVVLLAAGRAWRQVARLLGVLALTALLAGVLSSSLLMTNSGGALSGASGKSASATETLSSSGGFRLQWWEAAAQVGAHHPLAGAGFDSFAGAESRYQTADSQRSVYAHNVVLQAWSDGGLVLAVPLLLAMVAAGAALLLRLRQVEPALVAALCGGGVMLVHALVDFDAQYPASLALAVALLAVGSAIPLEDRMPTAQRNLWSPVAVLSVAVLALLAAGRFDAADALIRRGQTTGGAWTGAQGPLRDARFDVLRLARGDHDAALLGRTARLQDDSAAVTWSRAKALVLAGSSGPARQLADRAWQQRAANQPGQVTGYADVLTALHDDDGAAAVLVAGFRSAVARPGSDTEPLRLLQALTSNHQQVLASCLSAELPDRLAAQRSPLGPSCAAALSRFPKKGKA